MTTTKNAINKINKQNAENEQTTRIINLICLNASIILNYRITDIAEIDELYNAGNPDIVNLVDYIVLGK